MANDEALREALVELKMLREREAASLRASNAIVDALSSVTGTDRPGEALDRLLVSVRDSLDCAEVVLVTSTTGGATIGRATDPALLGTAFPDAVLKARGPMRVADTASLDWWPQIPARLKPMGAALGAPLRLPDQPLGLILCLAAAPAHFTPACKALLSRLTGLAAQALRTLAITDRNRLLAGVIDGSSASVAIAEARSEETPLVYVNDAFVQLSGYAADAVIGRNCRFLSDEPADSPERARLRAAVKGRQSGTFVLRNRRRDGGTFWNRLTLYPIADPEGDTAYLVATQVDITAERAAEAAREAAEYRLSAALSATSEGFLLLDAAGEVVFANARFQEFFGAPGVVWSKGTRFEDAWSARLEGLGTPRGQARRMANRRLAGMMSGAEGLEERLPDGRILLRNDRPLSDGGAVSTATDITSLKSTERMLAQRAAAIDATHDGIAVTDEDGRFVYMNAAHMRMFGLENDAQVVGRHWRTLYDPDQADLIERIGMPQLLERGTWRTEITGRSRDGSPVEQEVSLTMLKGIGLVCVTRDISERQRNERERARLRDQLHAAQRQEAIGQLAAGVAHDFNNLLSVISTSTTLVEQTLPDDHAARRDLGRIAAAGAQAAVLVGKLLETGRRPGASRPLDLGRALGEAVDLLRAGVPNRIAVTVETPGSPVIVTGDPGDLLQVVLNLGINARDALAQNAGEIVITLSSQPAASSEQVVLGGLEAGRSYAIISIRDTGPGMSPAVQREILTPYFTTKGQDGTGLGLAVVASIVHKIGGALALRSGSGKGTTFTLYWPADNVGSAREAAQEKASAAQDTLRRTIEGATVIVCDDVADVAESIAAILEAVGAETAVCTDPHDALEAIREDPQAWSLLITDFDMPGLDGAELCRAARAVRGDLPVMLCTALDPQGSRGALFDATIAKPVDARALVETAAGAMRACRPAIEGAAP